MQIIACSRIASIFFQSTEGAQVQRLSAIKMFQHSSVYRHQPPRSRTQATVPNHSDLAAWPHMKRGASIINTSSVNAYAGHPQLLDYTATEGAITAFTRAMHMQAVSSATTEYHP
ncbi:hypothetical protein Vretimale_18723 [Volvox reticuliferus]|uniref:Uncharacterized protein n=1 Tax=Volvox reticuliferus TaxID=1737510 RepID=A0A8J4CV38_9CHLO|nr:hypothetical protein Vretifemale_17189 [Volvox reticuliferus]GIM16065.1 hypothetical protein Vretimale_18723 [Volvox reticuliferus]